MREVTIMFRAIINVLIAIGSTGWIYLFGGAVSGLLFWLDRVTKPDYNPGSGVDFQIITGFLSIAILWFGIVLAFWIFFAVKRLWQNNNSKLRMIGNILLTAASVGWISPLEHSLHKLTTWFYWVHLPKLAQENNVNYMPYFQESMAYSKIVLFWLMIVVFFWALVMTSKLWPMGRNKLDVNVEKI